MTDKEAFAQILDTNEEVVETFKPNKTRAIIIGIIADTLVGLLFMGAGAGFLWVYLNGVKDASGKTISIVPVIFLFVFGFIVLVFGIIASIVRYHKTWYCYTNKRIIIRTGFIGADYKMLDFSGISAIDVRVDLLDKLIKPNTGKIIFGSNAAPILTYNRSQSRGEAGGYVFHSINNPYEVYKRVKEYVANANEKAKEAK